ncbi:hypothetical protein DSM112329_03753 [Paraconexibacter sp. AEG42_29]|uniref:HTH luxR-type domain-containing protein n=1 Tax=Paraconexibacter sp. AEG42_29 TaxID=2997339 RepID=A0AAU7AZ08_9ACTN
MPELLERDGPQAALSDAVAAGAAGAGTLVVVHGPAGIGKTTLLAQARADAEGRGLRVLHARGSDFERSFTFGVIRTLFERVVRGLAPVEQETLLDGAAAPAAVALGLSTEGTVDPSPGLFEALYWVVAGLCEREPLVLVVDDAQWVDAPSLRALAFLASRVHEHPLVLLVGIRDGEDCDDAPALAAIQAAAPDLPLAPLGAATVARIVADVAGEDLAPGAADAIYLATRGNPMFVMQAAQLARDRGAHDAAEPWSARAVAVVVLTRVAALGAAAAAVAGAVAIFGDGIGVAPVAAFTGLDLAEVERAAGELAAAGLLEAGGGGLAVAHPLMGEALRSDGGPRALALAHARAADVLRAAGEEPERFAAHLLRTLPAGDPAVARSLADAARDAARRGAPAAAIDFLLRARQEPPAPQDDQPIRRQLGIAQARAGRFADAAASLADVTGDAAAPLTTVVSYTTSAANTGTIGSVSDILHDAADQQDDPERRLELRSLAHCHSWYVAAADRRPFDLPPADTLAGTTIGERLALAAHSTFHAAAPSMAESVQVARRALGDGALTQQGPGFAWLAVNPLDVLVMAGQIADVDRELAAMDAVAQATASATTRTAAIWVHIVRSLQCGDLPAALAMAATIERFMAATPDGEPNHTARLLFAYRLEATLAHHGPAAADALMTAEGDPSARVAAGDVAAYWALPPAALLHLAQHRVPEAVAAARTHRAFVADRGGHVLPVWWEGALPLALAAAGETPEALALAEEGVAREQRHGVPARVAGALRVLARVDVPQSVGLLQEAVALHEEDPYMRLERAAALVDLGLALRRAGQRTDARAALERGAEAATGCQALPLAARAREELATLGARPRKLQFSGIESLTASERRTVDLVVQGRTNRQVAEELFVTAKTVEAHLGSAYRKLDINSRRDLAGALAGSTT